MTSYTIPSGVTKIGAQAFNDCFNLQNVNIPNGVTAIGRAAFWCCHKLSSVTLPKTITEIEDIPFYHCDGIEAFYGKFATEDFDALIKDNKLIAYAQSCGATSYEIPDGVIDIGRDVFSHCADLTSITIPASVTTIQAWAFNSCSGLTTVNCLGNTPPTYVPNGDVDIASNYYMFYIDAGADKYGNIEHIYVPEGAVEAYKTADYWDKYATFISEPTIPSNEIWYTSYRDEVIVATAFDAVVESNEYSDGKGVITFKSDVTKVLAQAFYNAYNLSSITLPASVTFIGDQAFAGCTKLAEISAPGVKSIGVRSFGSCIMTEISFPSLETIGNNAFTECSKLSIIDAPKVTSIGNDAFYGCVSLTNIPFPSLKTIGWRAFKGCTGLISVDIPNSVTTINPMAFMECTKLTSVTIPNGITIIPNGMFKNCLKLASVTIPDTVTTIDIDAFNNCRALQNITIPKNVNTIGNQAFYYCNTLTTVDCRPTSPPALGDDAFATNGSGRKIYVPIGSGETYKAANKWKDYKTFIEEW